MKLIIFAKHLKSLSIAELAARGRWFGVDGYDFPIRPGYAVNPDNVATALRELARALRAEGLALPMCTGDHTLLDPADPFAERLMALLAENGVGLLKPGTWRFRPEMDYWAAVDAARRCLEGWARLAERHGVAVCLQTHSGPWLGCNAAGLMHLLRGLDPRHIGAYLDCGHLALSGEDFFMACNIVGPRFRILGVKDMKKARVERDGRRPVQRMAVPVGEGVVDFEDVFANAKRVGFDGPVTMHVEYAGSDEAGLAATQRDARAYRAAMAAGA
jgi:sugar phosphate isomerase/epimerase